MNRDPLPLLITIDGPAGAGKTTVARITAQRLGLRFLDTGAMYRAAAWKARRLGIAHPLEIARMIASTRIEVEPHRVRCDGVDVTGPIRAPEIAALVRPIAESAECRAELVQKQRELGKAGGLVAEGRDQGSVVFPEARFKFYLDAALDVRAKRRHAETGGDAAEVARALAARDAQDRTRAVSPLVRPEGAVVIDTSGLTVDEVVDKILAAVRAP